MKSAPARGGAGQSSETTLAKWTVMIQVGQSGEGMSWVGVEMGCRV